MAIEIECEDCGNKYRVNDDKAGSKVRCRECGSKIEVPGGDDDMFDTEPANRPRPGKKRKKKSAGPPAGVIIGVAAVAAVAVIGIVLFSLMGGGAGAGGAQQVAQGNPPAPLPNSVPAPLGPPPGPANAVPGQVNPVNPATVNAAPAINQGPAATLPKSGNLPTTGLPKSTPPAVLPGGNNAEAGPANDGAKTALAQGNPAPAPVGKKFGGFANGDADGAGGDNAPDAPLPDNWTVQVDPSKLDTKIDTAKSLNMKFPKGSAHTDVVFPTTPSVFVALGSNGLNQQVREVWNLATKSKVGTVTNNLVHVGATSALSPDGQHLAASMVLKKTEGVMVWATKTGKMLGELEAGASVTSVLFPSPDRLVAVCRDGSAKVWEIPSGELKYELAVDKAQEIDQFTASPGGKYLAAVTDKTALKMFDLTTGELAGELSLPFSDKFFAGKPDAMSFSPDGAELAIVMPTGVFEKEFLVYNVADGKLLTKVELNVKNIGGRSDRVPGNRLEWFPDRSKLLWRGHHVLDARSGGPVWSAPDEDGSSDAPRKLLDDKRILIVVGGRQNPMLKTAPVPLDDITAAAKIVAAGGEASDAGMPQIMKADNSAATPIPVSAVANWTMKPDPTGEAKPVKASIPLPKDRPSIGSVFISNPETARAIVWYSDDFGAVTQSKGMVIHQRPGPPGGKGAALVDVVDLATGKSQSTLPLQYPSVVLDASPDGEAVAVKTTKPNDERIDVYTVSDGKPVAGWRPFQDKDDFFKGITLAKLIDTQHCLTQNFKGVVYLWKLPECKAIWRMETGKNFCLSPGGKYLGFQADNRYLFMEARTGELVAELPVIMPNINCAFHPVGTHLAMLSSDGVSRKITVVDVATGKPTADFFAPQGNDTIQWCGDASLLLDGKWLVDLKQQKNGWQYNLNFGTHARTQPDGRHWYVVSGGPIDQNVFLSGAVIPEKAVADTIDGAQLPDESLLQPGMQVAFQVNLAATSPTHPNLATDIGNNFRAGLEKNGFQVAAAGPYTFVITTAQSSDGEPMKFRSIGAFGAETSVPRIKVTCEVALLSNGQSVWKHTATMSNGTFGIVHLRDGEDITTHLSKQLWDSVSNHLTKFPVPAQVFGQTAGAGLGQSVFVPGGTQPGGR